MIRNLLNTLKNKKKKAKGFTLIELIIVIAIIAILAAIAIPKFMEIRENGNQKSDISTAKNIQTSVAALVADDQIKVTNETQTIEVKEADANGKKIIENLQDAPQIKSVDGKGAAGENGFYKVTIDKKGNIKVLLGTKEIYPKNVVFGADQEDNNNENQEK